MSQRTLALVSLAIGFGVTMVAAVLSRGFLEADDINHYLLARWSWEHPLYLLDVWARPLWTALYAPLTLAGPAVARLMGPVIVAATAWLAYRVACELGIRHAGWVVGLCYVQPMVLALSGSFLTEPLFALVALWGLRELQRGRPLLAALIIGFSPLARPEGYPLGVFVGAVLLLDVSRGVLHRRLLAIALLPVGTVIWNLLGWISTGDMLWLLHNWPWSAASPYAAGGPFHFVALLGWILQPVVVPFFALGVWAALRSPRWLYCAAALYIVVVHSLLHTFGLFGSAGLPRYLVTIAPLLALVSADGIDHARALFETRLPARASSTKHIALFVALVALGSAALSLKRVTPWRPHYDFVCMEEAASWVSRRSPEARHAIASDHPYLWFALGSDPAAVRVPATAEALAAAPTGTIVIWDSVFGADPSLAELAQLGYRRVPDATAADLERLDARRRGAHMYAGADQFRWAVLVRWSGPPQNRPDSW